MNNKKFICFSFLISISILLSVGLLNFIVDPLWTFNHSNVLNSRQTGFDERQQKTNYIYFNKLDKFEGILLGSSRATYINQNDFGNMYIYNYASSSMFPYEYEDYIEFAKKIKKQDLKYIIIGADFYGTNIPKDVKFKNPDFYIKNSESFFYKYQMLLSRDNFQNSIKNIKNVISKIDNDVYTRNNVKLNSKVSEAERAIRFTINIKRHVDDLSGDKYSYNSMYINILKKIKEDNPNSKFIIFTSPETADLLVSTIKKGNRINEYEKWLKELIDVFGEVHNFMTINTITKNLQNYPDDDHYYPNVAKLLANKLSNTINLEVPQDFGVLVTKENINKHLENLKKQIENYGEE